MLLDTRLVVDRARFRATLFRDGVQVFSAVGQARWSTPAGDFYVHDVLTRYRNPAYGPVAFGTSARSSTLTDGPVRGYIGIHGTRPAAPDTRRYLAWMHPAAQRRHHEAGCADAGRHPGNRPVSARARAVAAALIAMLVAAGVATPSVAVTSPPHERLPKQLLQRFPLNLVTTPATARSAAPPKAAASTATRFQRERARGKGATLPLVWLAIPAALLCLVVAAWTGRRRARHAPASSLSRRGGYVPVASTLARARHTDPLRCGRPTPSAGIRIQQGRGGALGQVG
jgi:hypothetical protein